MQSHTPLLGQTGWRERGPWRVSKRSMWDLPWILSPTVFLSLSWNRILPFTLWKASMITFKAQGNLCISNYWQRQISQAKPLFLTKSSHCTHPQKSPVTTQHFTRQKEANVRISGSTQLSIFPTPNPMKNNVWLQNSSRMTKKSNGNTKKSFKPLIKKSRHFIPNISNPISPINNKNAKANLVIKDSSNERNTVSNKNMRLISLGLSSRNLQRKIRKNKRFIKTQIFISFRKAKTELSAHKKSYQFTKNKKIKLQALIWNNCQFQWRKNS